MGLFGGFAVAFAGTRLLLFPLVMAPAALLQPRATIPGLTAHFAGCYALLNALLAALAVMQWVWFGAIVRCVAVSRVRGMGVSGCTLLDAACASDLRNGHLAR